jgi:hypothetical protein
MIMREKKHIRSVHDPRENRSKCLWKKLIEGLGNTDIIGL